MGIDREERVCLPPAGVVPGPFIACWSIWPSNSNPVPESSLRMHAMRRDNQFHPDLTDCVLEDRCLLALPPGLAPSPFMPVNSTTNQMIPLGSSVTGGGGGPVSPGPTFFYIRLGVNLGGFGVAGSSLGGTVSIFGLNTRPTALGGGGGGGGGGGSVGPARSGGGILRGFGSSFSSGFSFALSSLNNFGMNSVTGASLTLGTVPVHSYGGGGDLMDDAPANPNDPRNPAPGNQDPYAGPAPLPGPVDGGQGPNVNLSNRLLGKTRNAAAPPMSGPTPANTP
jgi:hypothetical protein